MPCLSIEVPHMRDEGEEALYPGQRRTLRLLASPPPEASCGGQAPAFSFTSVCLTYARSANAEPK